MATPCSPVTEPGNGPTRSRHSRRHHGRARHRPDADLRAGWLPAPAGRDRGQVQRPGDRPDAHRAPPAGGPAREVPVRRPGLVSVSFTCVPRPYDGQAGQGASAVPWPAMARSSSSRARAASSGRIRSVRLCSMSLAPPSGNRSQRAGDHQAEHPAGVPDGQVHGQVTAPGMTDHVGAAGRPHPGRRSGLPRAGRIDIRRPDRRVRARALSHFGSHAL
jgi:hypothetical protein